MVDRLVKRFVVVGYLWHILVSVSSMVDRLVKPVSVQIWLFIKCFSVLNGGPFGETGRPQYQHSLCTCFSVLNGGPFGETRGFKRFVGVGEVSVSSMVDRLVKPLQSKGVTP